LIAIVIFNAVVNPPIAPPQRAYHVKLRLNDVNGDLLSLSECRGFRRYLKATADNIGIGGTVQLYHHRDYVVMFEGPIDLVQRFFDFLIFSQSQHMIGEIVTLESAPTLPFLVMTEFSIQLDHSKTKRNGGHVIKGKFSDEDEEFDKISHSSSNSQVYLGNQKTIG
jgi:acylphosphatase